MASCAIHNRSDSATSAETDRFRDFRETPSCFPPGLLPPPTFMRYEHTQKAPLYLLLAAIASSILVAAWFMPDPATQLILATSGGWTWNLWGFDCVDVYLTRWRKLRIGTEAPIELASVGSVLTVWWWLGLSLRSPGPRGNVT